MKKQFLQKTILPVVFILGISFVIFVSLATNIWISKTEEARFNLATEQTILLLKNRLESNVQLLRSLSGLFIASDEVTKVDFEAFFNIHDIENRFPGVKAFGYSPIISPDEQALFEQKASKESMTEFHVFPNSENMMIPVYYLYPLTEQNKKVLGYDMASSDIRIAAMSKSALTKSPIISNQLELVQENVDSAGFVIYMPTFEPQNNKEDLSGFVYVAVKSQRLFTDLFGARFLPIDIEIYDGNEISPESLLYDSNSDVKNTRLLDVRNIDLYGRDWTLRIKSKNVLDMGIARFIPWVELVFGSLFVLVISGWIFALGRTKEDAQAMARNMLKTVQDQMKIIDENVILSETNLKGIITNVSQAYSKISGYSKEELIGKAHFIVRHEDMPSSLYVSLWENLKLGKNWRGEIKNRRKDGSHYWVEALIMPKFDENQEMTGYTSIRQDITDKKRIEELSITDTLTGLFNRLKLDELFKTFLNISLRHGYPFSIIIIDIDFFKLVNDNHGHQIGDTVLKEFAQILKSNVRIEDTVGRWGGEEFLILAPGSDLEAAARLAEKLRKIIEKFNFTTVGQKTSSFGVSTCHAGDDEKSMISRADEALYAAKNGGRNLVKVENYTM